MKAKKNEATKLILYLALALLYLLHNDFWNWSDAERILGLPVGLAYHVGFCLAAALLFHLLVRHAWPEHLESSPEEDPE